jgi:hypothetical protein
MIAMYPCRHQQLFKLRRAVPSGPKGIYIGENTKMRRNKFDSGNIQNCVQFVDKQRISWGLYRRRRFGKYVCLIQRGGVSRICSQSRNSLYNHTLYTLKKRFTALSGPGFACGAAAISAIAPKTGAAMNHGLWKTC